MAHPLMLGCDPGLKGGIALVYSDGSAEAWNMPATERDVLDLVRELATRWTGLNAIPRATIETVHAMPKQGVTSTFTFGRGYGGLRMALLATEYALYEVTPQRWQGALGCRSGGDKNVTKAKAQQLFPGIKVTHAIADSLLIATWGAKEVGA